MFLCLPQGVVRIFLLEAQSLVSMDNYGIISGKSDPYVILKVGPQVFTSHHVENDLNPQWREMYEVRLCGTFVLPTYWQVIISVDC